MKDEEYLINLEKDLYEKIKTLNSFKTYYLSCDEGGMFGLPRFNISNSKKLQNYHFEMIGKLSEKHILNYIIGRLLYWRYGLGVDYSKTNNLITIK